MLRHFGPKMADGTFIGNTAQALKDLDTGTAMPMSALVAH